MYYKKSKSKNGTTTQCATCPTMHVVLKDQSGCACDSSKRRYSAQRHAFACVPEGATFAARRADFSAATLEMNETKCATMKQDPKQPCVKLGTGAPRPVVLPTFGVSQKALASLQTGEAGEAGAAARGIAVFPCPGSEKFNPCPNFNGTLACATGHTGPL